MGKSMVKAEEIKKLVDDLQKEVERQDRRLQEYYLLVGKIDKIAAGSNSRKCDEINMLIEEHYVL